MSYGRAWVGVLLLLLAVACDESTDRPHTHRTPTYELVNAFPNLEFARPVGLQSAGDGTNRLFVVEQGGVIRWFVNADTVTTSHVFLDLSAQVTCCGESGLLGLAFHPQYDVNGYFFVYYTPSPGGATVVSRFQVSADPGVADAGSEKVLLTIPQQYGNHNGGQVAFGPDGYLYIAVGDEGGAGDPNDNAQDLTDLHGSILRLDVDQNTATPPYHAIPIDNPFYNNAQGYREEIYAYGLRNPWRFSFDPPTGRLWCGDVGQRTWEEIDIVVSGGNYGWDCREGMHPFVPQGADDDPSAVCDTISGLIDPVWEYGHGSGQSITGGYVYRGSDLPGLVGKYVYADFGSGLIWALDWDGVTATNEDVADPEVQISSFGIDGSGELFVCRYSSISTTGIYKLRATPTP